MTRLRTFYTIAFTQTISMLGSQMTTFGIAIWLFQTTGNAFPGGVVLAFTLLPNVLLANIAGLVADRYDRRWIMALTDMGAAVGSILLMALFVSGNFQVWHLYAVTLLVETFRTFQKPAFTASITLMAPDSHRDLANAIRQLGDPLASVFSPAVTAAVYSVAGIAGVLAVDLLTFLLAVITLLLVQIPTPPRANPAEKSSLWRELLAGYVWLLGYKPMLALMLYSMLYNFLVQGLGALLMPYFLGRLSNDEVLMGAIISVNNLGAIVGAVIIGVWRGTRPRIHTIMIGLALTGVALILGGMAQTPAALTISFFLVMLVPMIAYAPLTSMLQAKVPPAKQGRVFAAISQVTQMLSFFSPLLLTLLADRVFEPAADSAGWWFGGLVGSGAGAGIGLMIVLMGGVIVVGALVTYALPIVRRMEATIPDWEAVPADSLQSIADSR